MIKRITVFILIVISTLLVSACQNKQEDTFTLPTIPEGYVVDKSLYLAEGDGIYAFIENELLDYETIIAEICNGNVQSLQEQYRGRGSPKENLEEYAAIQNLLGITEVYMGNYDRAYIYFIDTIKLLNGKNLPNKNKILTVLYNNAGADTINLTKHATNDKRLKKAADLCTEPFMGLVIAVNQIGRAKTHAPEKEFGIMIARAKEIIKKEEEIKISPDFVRFSAVRYMITGYMATGQELKAIEILNEYIPQIYDSPEYYLLKAVFLSYRGYCRDTLEEYESAINDFQSSIALAEKTVDDNSRQLAATYNRLGVSYMNCEDYNAGLDYFKKALPGFKFATPPDKGVVYWNAGNASYQLEQYDQAKIYLLKSYINNQMIIEELGSTAGEEFGRDARQVLLVIYYSEKNDIADFDEWLMKGSEKYKAEEYSYHRYPDKLG